MEINDFVTHFASQFEDTEASEFYAEKNFREIEEWSSLSALSIMAMVDEHYKVKLSGEDIRKSSTIMDLFEIVKERVV